MKKAPLGVIVSPISIIILICFLFTGIGSSKVITVISENAPVVRQNCIIIDAGHGGLDGGSTSCTGVLESGINLEIALKLDDLFHLLGINTLMIRTTDCSIHTKGDSIASKKVSDLKERVRIVNNTANSILISIHQNHFPDSKYNGAQIFYAPTESSQILATQLQTAFVTNLNPGSNRKAKKADGIYLMQNITRPGILVECGFLSNHIEEAKLRDFKYQQNICCVIAGTVSTFLYST